MKKIFLPGTISLFVSCISVFSQSRIRTALDTLQKFYPREKIYILYDKTEYVAGETIWFSSFVFSDYSLSNISTNLIVELYDGNKGLISRKQLPLFKGQSAGKILLPEKLAEGIYYIHAYTQWMLNFPEEFQYIHSIRIFNPESSKKLQAADFPWKAEAFPEGGNLVDDIRTNLAVRLTSPSSLPSDWNGYIIEKGKTEKISEFKSLDQNTGIVEFTPAADHQYQIVVEDKKEQKQVIPLPAVASSGVHLEVNNFYDSIQYVIYFKNIPGSGTGYRLVGTVNNELVYEASIKRADKVLKRFIPTNNLFNGILRLSLFDSNDSVVAERLCFIKPTMLEVKTPVFTEKKINPAPRSLNSFQFQSDTIESPYSVLVLDPIGGIAPEDDNFLSALWLSNDISNPVEKPAQYFNNPDANSAKALDALLMSESWKGFSWNDILHKKYPSIKYLPDNYIGYKVTVYRNKKLVPNEMVNMIFVFPDSSKQIVQGKTGNAGSFIISNLFFYDTVKVYYQLNQKKSAAKDIHIEFESFNSLSTYHLTLPETGYVLTDRPANEQSPEFVARSLNTLNNLQMTDAKYKSLGEVKVRTTVKKAKEKLNDELSTPAFQSINETVFDFVNEDQHADGYSNILQWLQGRVAGLQISTDNNGDIIPLVRGSQVSIFLDEIPVEPAFINGFPVSDIAMVKVIKGFFVGGMGGGGGGAIAIYSKKGGMRTSNSEPSLNYGKLAGYEKMKDFPSPDYGDSFYRQQKKDERDVLYWKPFAVPGDDVKVAVDFYNNDTAKEFRVVILGFTMEGIPVYYNGILR